MSNLVKSYTGTPLVLRIAIGLVIGAVIGAAAPGLPVIPVLGGLFVGALKGIAPLLVFLLVISSLSAAGRGIGGRFTTVIILYVASTLLAALTAVCGSFLFPATMELVTEGADSTPPGGIGEVIHNLLTNMVTNPIASIANANYIGVLFWAVVLGLALKAFATSSTVKLFNQLADAASAVVRWIIQLAPFGILGLVYDAVSTSGLAIFTTYGRLLVLLVGCMVFVALVMDPILVFVCTHKNPYPLVFRCLRESGVTAFFTRSSAANIPVNMDLCKRLGLDRNFYSVSIPLGATINMDGAAVTITVMTLAVAHTLGISVDIPSAILLSVLATLGACGASGVAGGSLLLIPMACSLFGISNDIAMQAVAVGFIIGVVQDSVETALNSSGDVMFAAAAEARHARLNPNEAPDYETNDQ